MKPLGLFRRSFVVPSLLLVLSGCGGPLRYSVRGTPRAPEADGTIVADVRREQNMTRLQVRMEHLAPPGRLQEGGRVYVVWSRHNSGATWNRIGTLTYNDGSRVGEMADITVPEQSFEMSVTVETDPTAQTPSSTVIATQMVNPPRHE